MSPVAEPDGSEDVNDFLQRIRELGDKRDKEDEERTKKLEEEILQGRKERQARRAERARSLSPTKEPPSNTSTPASIRSIADTPTSQKMASSTPDLPRLPLPRDENRADALDRLNGAPSATPGEQLKEATIQTDLAPLSTRAPVLSKPSPSAAMPLSRTPTLSWQQRPTSRGSTGARARPLSIVATENNASRSPRATPEPTYASEKEVSRDQIAQALGSKDPSWFKQTADRVQGSAAYRRNQEDPVSDSAFMAGSMRLPGMSEGSVAEPLDEIGPLPDTMRSVSPSRQGSIRGSVAWSQRFPSTTSLSSASGLGSPLPTLSSQRFEAPSDTTSSHGDESPAFSRPVAMSPSQGRISPERMERPPSPTKGLGGFVQSAMLKRSDSVNKRWSAQASPGLSRGNSVASNRGGYPPSDLGLLGWSPPKEPRPGSLSRDNSPMPGSRPGSGHSHATVTQNAKDTETPGTPALTANIKVDSPSLGSLLKPAIPHHSRTQTVGHLPDESHKDVITERSAPPSPSKTIDQKKWSPMKASWLESAINKPDSPKPRAPPPQQPSWMAEISRAKQQRGSVDLGKPASFKEVTATSLLRSPPMGPSIKSPTIGRLPSGFTSDRVVETKEDDVNGFVKSQGLPARSEPNSRDSDLSIPLASPGDTASPDRNVKQSEAAGPAAPSPSSPQASDLELTLNQKYTLPAKVKPETPPKKDFRSTLKPRQASGGDEISTEPEFRNVFGKLKRTQTQNYIAPDELKDNILRGKAGLAVTGGPKKPDRKDELKESLLKQKEAMKAGLPSMTRKTSRNVVTQEQAPSIPEAIAKRNGLTRSESTLSNPVSDAVKEPTTPEAISRHQSLKSKPKPIPPDRQAGALDDRLPKEPAGNSKLADRFNPALIGILSRGPSPMTGNNGTARSKPPQALYHNSAHVASDDEPSGAQLIHMTKSRARGPKRRLPTVVKKESSPKTAVMPIGPRLIISSPKTDAEEATQRTPLRSSSELPVRGAIRPLANIIINNNKTTPPLSPRKPSTSIKSFDVSEADDVPPKVSQPGLSQWKPSTPVKSLEKGNVQELSSTLLHSKPIEAPPARARTSPPVKREQSLSSKEDYPSKASIASPASFPTLPAQPLPITQGQDLECSPSVTQQHPDEQSTGVVEPETSVKDAAAMWGRSPPWSTPLPQRAKSPIRLPSRQDEDTAKWEAGLNRFNPQEPIGLGLRSVSVEVKNLAPLDRNLPSPPMRSPKSPPLPAKKPASITNRIVSNGSLTDRPKPSGLPATQNPQAASHFSTFFESIPSSHPEVSIDTNAVLTSRASAKAANGTGKIKTLRKLIYELTSSGKKLPVPSQQEHILYEENMYLCTHVFGHPVTGTRTTEVYLWCGDGVAPSAIEDAQLFARKAAKETGGTFIVLKQGKETANFFQALGGIVIVRRGSSSRAPDSDSSSSSSNATYMLCGRQHVGQIAFDEVDFGPQSLCSAFPYIISASFGKLYLWKGRGSGADELGCARLIGMDLGLTGEIDEVDEGTEDDAFWDVFPAARAQTRRLPDKAYWTLKPGCDKYAPRFFTVEHELRPKSSSGFKWVRRGSAPADDGAATAQIREVAPFAQADLAGDSVFVLDAFFEIFVILTPSARSLAAPFLTALLFAQEYGILAASLEDRPFVPVASVVLPSGDGAAVPRDLKAVFRKWDERMDVLGERGGCRVLPLSVALEAMRG
ncbi:MAG: hypothetical protein FRX48_04464 [Lasallia pustulata]|uniref:Uncharacterized protein n=1 Tax=Lasallia pustulata TaxID=136370 RepID=A0A5M8PTH7_9LECA|nr:MAG: hypothetical protein FRX48_04464 [Lasallia pustulata]